MPEILQIDGRLHDPRSPALSALDAGLQHGVGLFETMLGGSEGGRPWVVLLDEHLERLTTSVRELGLSDSIRAAGLADAVLEAVRAAGLARARVRLTLTGGDLNLLARARGEGPPGNSGLRPSIIVHVQPATVYPPAMLERGVPAIIASFRLNPLDPTCAHKTLNYWTRLRELQLAAARQAGEAIVFSITNHVSGGCVSSIILARHEGGLTRLIAPIARGEERDRPDPTPDPALGAPGTPGVALPSPVLPGITRAWALETARRRGWAVATRLISIDDLLNADEVLLTNSSWGVLPVVKVEAEEIGQGAPGAAAETLREAWDDLIDSCRSGAG